ncbi:MAG: hypothetical protein U9R19_06590, partial [Bacteroidota bacterium]|nr:hypothetical protein [Bacteroidota bacterium]
MKKQINYRKFNLLIIALLLVFGGCDKNKDKPEKVFDKFDLSIGKSWKYHRTAYFKNPVPANDTTGLSFENDTVADDDITVEVEKTALINGLETIQLTSRQNNENGVFTEYQFYTNDTSGLKIIAYKVSGLLVLPKQNLKNRNNFIIPSFLGLNNFTQNHDLKQDTLYYDNPPATVFQYPLVLNKTWLLRSAQPFSIDKKVIDKVIVSTKIGDFECYKIEYIYEPEQDWKIYEYVTEKAIVKREIFIDSCSYTNEYGEIISMADWFDTYEIV